MPSFLSFIPASYSPESQTGPPFFDVFTFHWPQLLQFTGSPSRYPFKPLSGQKLLSQPVMSMLKIPVTILVSWAFKKCVTPPLPPPPKNELMHPNVDVEWYTQGVLPVAAVSHVSISHCRPSIQICNNIPHLGHTTYCRTCGSSSHPCVQLSGKLSFRPRSLFSGRAWWTSGGTWPLPRHNCWSRDDAFRKCNPGIDVSLSWAIFSLRS